MAFCFFPFKAPCHISRSSKMDDCWFCFSQFILNHLAYHGNSLMLTFQYRSRYFKIHDEIYIGLVLLNVRLSVGYCTWWWIKVSINSRKLSLFYIPQCLKAGTDSHVVLM